MLGEDFALQIFSKLSESPTTQKKRYRYIVTFIGESGINTGVISRE